MGRVKMGGRVRGLTNQTAHSRHIQAHATGQSNPFHMPCWSHTLFLEGQCPSQGCFYFPIPNPGSSQPQVIPHVRVHGLSQPSYTPALTSPSSDQSPRCPQASMLPVPFWGSQGACWGVSPINGLSRPGEASVAWWLSS